MKAILVFAVMIMIGCGRSPVPEPIREAVVKPEHVCGKGIVDYAGEIWTDYPECGGLTVPRSMPGLRAAVENAEVLTMQLREQVNRSDAGVKAH